MSNLLGISTFEFIKFYCICINSGTIINLGLLILYDPNYVTSTNRGRSGEASLGNFIPIYFR